MAPYSDSAGTPEHPRHAITDPIRIRTAEYAGASRATLLRKPGRSGIGVGGIHTNRIRIRILIRIL